VTRGLRIHLALAVAWGAWASGAGAQGGSAEPTRGGAPPRAVVLEAAAQGVDPVVGAHVTRRMTATVRAMGYEAVDRAATVSAARRVRVVYPPSPADLWNVTAAAGATRGAVARVWAEGRRYVVEVTVASLDGAGPFVARGDAGAEDLHDVVDRLTRQALPDPADWDAEAADRLRRGAPAARGPDPATADWDRPAPSPPRPPEPRDRTPRYRFELAAQTEAVIGTSSDRFYNHLAGVRVGLRINEDLILSTYLGYANLRGRGNRVGNLLPYLQIEHRVRVSEREVVNLPLRAAVGYLPFNGPVFRFAGGLNFPFGDRYELGLDLLAPSFWMIPGGVAVAFNLAAELVVRL
jgi:hypothetical protein